jgi:hypothetical protein
MSFVEKFNETGWLQMGGLFPTELIDRLRVEVAGQLGELLTDDVRHRSYLRVGDQRAMLSVKLQGPLLDPQVYGNPILLAVLGQLLGADMVIDSFTCVVAMAGAADQREHRDHPPLFPLEPKLGDNLPPYSITVVIPLIDLTPETGTTRLFPGTHRGSPQDPELPYVGRGDCFLFDYRLLHHGSANRTEAVRPVLYVTYSRPWFIDVENFDWQARINIEPEDVQRIPTEHWPLFRRLACKGAMNLSEAELFPTE